MPRALTVSSSVVSAFATLLSFLTLLVPASATSPASGTLTWMVAIPFFLFSLTLPKLKLFEGGRNRGRHRRLQLVGADVGAVGTGDG